VTPSITAEALLDRYVEAWNAHDAWGCADCFTPDGVRTWRVLAPAHIPGDPFPTFAGRAAVRRGIQGLMDGLPDLGVEVLSVRGAGDRLALEWRLCGTHVNDWGPWAARGEAVDVVGVSLLDLLGGEIAEERVFWDMALMTGPPSTTAPAAAPVAVGRG
jgi:uncharacterized protein (TIGR02246 family)